MEPGARLGPYEIVAPLGAGGMGEVYRARDTRLGREVAIKVLPAEFAADPDRVARFEREARALAALSHPGILGIFDFGREGDVTYAVTELLEGEDLRARLRRERLPVRKAVEIVAAVADGLAAAHGKGIVHRDLKPENVFLTSAGHVKILDFGLARLASPLLAEAQTRLSMPPGTVAGTVLGTVGYMSPEQVRGVEADARSDIFALGCVLYETLTGRQTFKRDTAAETMAAILQEPAPEISASGVAATPELNGIVAHCLEKQPSERFQSAGDVAFALRSLATGGAPAPAAASRGATRRWLAPAVVGLAGAAAAALLLWSPWRTHATAAALAPRRIVVAAFENQTGDASLDPFGHMAADWITQGLSRIPTVETVPAGAARQAEQATLHEGTPGARGDPVRALGEATGAGIVVSGSYYLQGPTLQLQARVTDAATGALIYAVGPVSGAREVPTAALDALGQRLMGVIAARFDQSLLNPELIHPPLYEAYREYAAGLELFGQDDAQSIRHFQKAVEIDPEFAAPQVYIGYAYWNNGDYARADAIARRVNEHREKLRPLERHVLDSLRALVAGRYTEALHEFRQGEKMTPKKSPIWTHMIGWTCIGVNLPRQTVDTFAKVNPESFSEVYPSLGQWAFGVLLAAHHMLSEYERELEVADQAIRSFPELLTFRAAKVRALVALGRLDEANRVIDDSLAVPSRDMTPAGLMLSAAVELRAHGHRAAALQTAARAVDWLGSRPPSETTKDEHRVVLAAALYAAERWDEARPIYQELAARVPLTGGHGESPNAPPTPTDVSETVRVSRAIAYAGALGALAARRGDRGEALRVSAELARLDRPFLFGAHTYGRARIAALLGERQQAVDLLRESFAQGNSYGVNLHRAMDLEPLHGYAPFEELLKPKG
ncbi:MAG TPA: protein kinase [Thermoanaerobaculaceae bacterium]|nr:protein kinase [Thermoanaerobaculaceae bacterium]